jgi:hypothetical protein
MFHACVQRFDGMDEKIFGGELNRALASVSSLQSALHIRPLQLQMLRLRLRDPDPPMAAGAHAGRRRPVSLIQSDARARLLLLSFP